MPTVSDWITETKDHLSGSYTTVLDELAVGTLANGNAITLSYTDRLLPSTVLSIGGEDMLVRTWDAVSRTATVRRGWRGSTQEDFSAGTEVEVNPRFTNGQIKRRLLQEVRSWPQNLFRVETSTLETLSSHSTFVSWPTPIRSLLIVQVQTGGNDMAWHPLPYARRRATGDLTRIDFGAFIGPAQTVEVHVGTDFVLDPWDDDTDLVEDVGLAPSMLDIGPMGAALRLVGFSELTRSDRSVQGEPRWAEESPPGHASETMQALWRYRNSRIADEIGRLRSAYPMMS